MSTLENGLFLLLQAFSSGVAGFITNKYAVNMIFKEYTPLKIGGAVKKNKEKFIEEVSDLVERDIINSSTLKNKVLSEDFRVAINNSSEDFFKKSLYDIFENKKVEEIPGYEQTILNTKTFIENNIEGLLQKFLSNIDEHISIQDLLSKKQIAHIVDFIYDEVSQNIESSEHLKELVNNLYEEQKQISLDKLISEESHNKITRIISCEIMNSIDELLQNKKDIKLIVDKSLSLINIKELIKDFQKNKMSKSIDDILSEEEIEKLSSITYKKIDELVKSEQGQKKLQEIIEEIFTCAKEMDLTIFEILPIHFGRTSSEYIVDLIKKAIPYIVVWMRGNKQQIENIIDESIIESIEDIDDELRKAMILKAKDTMLVDFASKNEIVEKIISFLKEYEISEEDSYKLYSKVINFLEKTKIKDIVLLLEDKNLINEEIIMNFVLNKWDSQGQEISRSFVKSQTTKPLNTLITKDLNKLFNDNIKIRIYDLIEKNKEKILFNIDKIVFNLVQEKVDLLLTTQLDDLVKSDSVDKFSKLLPIKLVNILNKNKISYKKIINTKLNDYIKDIKLKNILKENEDKLINSTSQNVSNLVKDKLIKYKSYEIKNILDFVNKDNKFEEVVNKELYENIKDNLPKIVDGKVKKVIYDNLIKLDEDEICNIAQSFMGKQLKPLSIFGAFLGTMVGLIFGITMTNISGQYGFYNNIQNTVIACVLMGLVGVMTNVIALWMIFCPYEKNNFIAKIPIFKIFSIGYIPSHKASFANGMASFIENELLSGDRIVNSFDSQKDKFKKNIMINLKDSNYMIALNLLRNKKHYLSKKIYESILRILKKHNSTISSNISNELSGIECEEIVSQEKIDNFINKLMKNINNQETKLIQYIEDKLKTNKSLEEILPDNLIDIIDKKIEKDIKEYTNKTINTSNAKNLIRDMVLRNEDNYNDMIEKSINDILGSKSILNIKDSIKSEEFINLILLELKSQLKNYSENYLEKEFPSNKTIGELFDGKIKIKLDKEIYSLTDLAINLLIKYVKENNELISSMAIKIVRQNLSFFAKIAYDFADGDGLVRDVITRIIQNKIEDLIIKDKQQLYGMVYDYLSTQIYPSEIGNIGIRVSEIDINLILERLVFSLKANEQFKIKIGEISDITVDNLCNIKAQEISEIILGDNLSNILERYNDFIDDILQMIVSNLIDNKNEVDEFIRSLTKDKILKHSYSVDLVEISWELNKEDISYTVDNMIQIINSSEVIKNNTEYICNYIYNHYIKNKKLGSMINDEILQNDIYDVINISIQNKDFNCKNISIVEVVIDEMINNKLEFIDDKSKEFIIENLIDSGFDCVQNNIIPVLKTLDLQSITLEEVDKMHPREIHMLFKSFAGDFFIKLYVYGGFGAIFGINVYLSIVLFILDTIYTKKIESKSVESQYKLFRD